MHRTIIVAVLFLGLGAVLGSQVDSLMPESKAAAGRVVEVKLGHPTSTILSAVGHPLKISYGTDHQVWFYADAGGEVRARFWINEGVVVRIHED